MCSIFYYSFNQLRLKHPKKESSGLGKKMVYNLY